MKDKEIIEALKANEKPYGLMSEAMQAKAEEIQVHNFLALTVMGEFRQHSLPDFLTCDTFQLSRDYEEKPEIVECEVQHHAEDNSLCYRSYPSNSLEALSCAQDNPDFIGFKYEDGNIYPQPVMYSENGGLHFISQIENFASGKDIANRPTHVLFQVTK